MSGTLNESFCILNKVLREGAYVNLALNEDAVGAMARRIVLGVLERYYKLNYMISRLVPKAPKAVVRIVLMQGIYCLTETEMPRYAVVDESVKLTGAIGKKELKGLVNAVLQRVADGERPLPDKQDPAYEEVELNAPRWLIQMLKKEYPKAYKRILKGDETHLEHIRLCRGEDAKRWENAPGVIARTATGFFVRPDEEIRTAFSEGRLTYQSLTSTYAVLAAGAVEGMRVLDLCAAPGGKTTDAAASLRAVFGDGFLLVSNEVIRQRATVLAGNVALWGDPSVVVSSSDPAVVGALEGYFDVVLADVPCSGEGMFRKDADAVAQWSAENVEHCAARQRRILADVWPALAENGILVYSTCTFNRYENDMNVRWAADNLGADIVDIGSLAGGALPDGVMATECGCSLVPGFVRGEGQFCAVLRKRGGMERVADIRAAGGRQPDAGVPSVFSGRMYAAVRGDLVKAVPEAVSGEIAFLESRIRLISSGCAAFMRRGKDLVPCADLALDIKLLEDAFPRVEVDRDLALKYLHRDTFALPGVEKGYVLICFEGHPLGFVKNLGGRCNNLHPQERRIRMDIG